MTPKKEKNFIAVLSYLTIVGWLVALILHNKHTTQFSKFHLQQALPLHILSMIFYFLPFLRLLNIIIFVFILIGVIYAAQSKKKHLPIIGELAEELLSDL